MGGEKKKLVHSLSRERLVALLIELAKGISHCIGLSLSSKEVENDIQGSGLKQAERAGALYKSGEGSADSLFG